MPKKAVTLFFVLAFVGAAIFVFLTFPRTKDQIPTSNNQRPFPSTPVPAPNTPDNVPVPDRVPHPDAPKVPPGPTLHVMAWATGPEVARLEAQTDAFTKATGRVASLTIDGDEASYRRDLQQTFASGAAPDVCLVAARDFSGIDPSRVLADVVPASYAGTASRSLAALTVEGHLKAVPDEYSVNVLYYHRGYFDQAGIGYPDRHWNWDMLEADARALDSLKLKDGQGREIYPIEMPADFDLWNILCTDAGHPALDLNAWHLTDEETRESQVHALEFIHEIFQDLSVTAPLPKTGVAPGSLFAQQRSALLVGPSDLTASFPDFPYAFTLLPGNLARSSLARVNGWAVAASSGQADAARALAGYLAFQPVHAGWRSVQKPTEADSPDGICYEALSQALVPRLEPKAARMAQFIDHQIDQLARTSKQSTDDLYARIQTEFQGEMTAQGNQASVPRASAPKPLPKLNAGQLREL